MSDITYPIYGWANPAQPTQTVQQVFRKFFSPATPTIVNEIPVCGAIQRIRQVQTWGVNWDGADALAVPSAAAARATALIDKIYSTSSQLNIDWIDPNVTASPHGEVVLEWWNNEKKLTIYVNEKLSEYVKVWGPDIDEEMEDGVLSDDQTANMLIWLES